jgi:predicted aspartyl protease
MEEDKILKFSYTKVPVTDIYGKKIGEAYRPIVTLTLLHDSRSLDVLALIDTGADECLFPGEFATILGHNLTKGKPRTFAGIGGAITAYLHQTDIKLGFHKLRVNIYYSDDWNKWGFGLLGQNSFLTRFDAFFSRQNKEFSLTLRS